MDSTGWGVLPDDHERVADNTNNETIATVIESKCFFYYDFEAIMGSALSNTPTFLAESGQADRKRLVDFLHSSNTPLSSRHLFSLISSFLSLSPPHRHLSNP